MVDRLDRGAGRYPARGQPERRTKDRQRKPPTFTSMRSLELPPVPRRTAASFNKSLERTAAMRFGLDGDGLQAAVVAVESALPAAVAHPCR